MAATFEPAIRKIGPRDVTSSVAADQVGATVEGFPRPVPSRPDHLVALRPRIGDADPLDGPPTGGPVRGALRRSVHGSASSPERTGAAGGHRLGADFSAIRIHGAEPIARTIRRAGVKSLRVKPQVLLGHPGPAGDIDDPLSGDIDDPLSLEPTNPGRYGIDESLLQDLHTHNNTQQTNPEHPSAPLNPEPTNTSRYGLDESLLQDLHTQQTAPGQGDLTGPDLPAAPPTAAPPTAAPRKGHNAFLLAQMHADYAGETAGARGDVVEAIKMYETLLQELAAAVVTLEGGAPIAAAKDLVQLDVATKARLDLDETPQGRAEAAKILRDKLKERFELAQRQDLPTVDGGMGKLQDFSDRKVHYDSPEEQAESVVTPKNGLLYRASGEPVDTRDSSTFTSGVGTEIFVASEAGEIHMGSHKIGKYHHSSLLAGSLVSIGGEIRASEGMITGLSNKSGHYKPTKEHLVQFLHWLKKDGVALDFPVWGYGVPAGLTAADVEGGVDADGNADIDQGFHATKLRLLLLAYRTDPNIGPHELDRVLADEGLRERNGQVVDHLDEVVDEKDVIDLLKRRLGPPGAKMVANNP